MFLNLIIHFYIECKKKKKKKKKKNNWQSLVSSSSGWLFVLYTLRLARNWGWRQKNAHWALYISTMLLLSYAM